MRIGGRSKGRDQGRVVVMGPVFGSKGVICLCYILNIRDRDRVERYMQLVVGAYSIVDRTYRQAYMCDLLQVRDQLPKGETRRLPRVLNRETAGLTRSKFQYAGGWERL